MIKGNIIYSQGKKQIIELLATKINVIGIIKNPDKYPISPKKHTKKFLRKYLHLRSRTNLFRTIFILRNYLYKLIHKYLNKKKFYWISTPLITNLNTEGNDNMFKIDAKYLSKPYFLTVSGQLHLESFACSLSKVYSFGPVFRADNSNTNRHLSEFWMLEIEIAFINLEKIINFAKKFIKYIINNMLKNKNLIYLNSLLPNDNLINNLIKINNNEFIDIDYKDVIKILKKYQNKFIKPIKWGIDLQREHEFFLTKEYFNNIIIVKNYPKKIKPFYMKINNDNKTVAAMDILFPNIGEIIGGSQREDDYNLLKKNIKTKNLSKKYYKWYLDLRKYGTIPHSGFGLGFDRLLCYLTGLKNIKDTIPFPRSIKNINF